MDTDWKHRFDWQVIKHFYAKDKPSVRITTHAGFYGCEIVFPTANWPLMPHYMSEPRETESEAIEQAEKYLLSRGYQMPPIYSPCTS